MTQMNLYVMVAIILIALVGYKTSIKIKRQTAIYCRLKAFGGDNHANLTNS